tara:strand:+ start:4193 stop:4624 length:432 start_codon:yes stop_codon:yes gene_type:complete
MVVAIACDHAGFDVKEKLKKYLSEKLLLEVTDLGTYSLDSVDYPNFGHKVGVEVSNGSADKGIVICGSGIGISIAANKVKGIRAALCTSVEHAELSRKHNDANVLALGARLTSLETIYKITDTWLDTSFEQGRHLDRIKLIEL